MQKIENLCADINYNLSDDVLAAVKIKIYAINGSLSDSVLKEIGANAQIAKDEKIALCQDTGTANFFVRCGKNIIFEDNEDNIFNS